MLEQREGLSTYVGKIKLEELEFIKNLLDHNMMLLSQLTCSKKAGPSFFFWPVFDL